MGFPEYRNDLLAPDFDPNRVLDIYFHSGQSAVFDRAPPDVAASFKRDLAHRLQKELRVRLHPLQLIVCGSAHLGFSPVPDKLGKPFDHLSSDIDVAVVSTDLFDNWWSELQAIDFPSEIRKKVATDLFWGFINPATVNQVSDIGKQWWNLFKNIQTNRARGVRGRLYRNHWSMQSYHMHAIQRGREQLKGANF